MKRTFKTISVLLVAAMLLTCIQQATCQQMYRGNAAHNLNNDSGIKGFFNVCQWKFDAGAPIRSTAVAASNSVYFGSSKGVFYCLDRNTGKVTWTFRPGYAINSSAAVHNNHVFFSDNRQSLYCLDAVTGRLQWKTDLGPAKNYDWAFDYTYSSPALIREQILIGSKDGCVYNIAEASGKIKWRFKTEGIVRCSPAVAGNTVYAGDTEGNFFAVDLATGKQKWRFALEGHSLRNEKFGFDRRAVIAAPVIAGSKVIVGARDGFLYCLDKNTGRQLWRVDHEVSWIISAVAVKGSTVVTGTSDGHFVQALDLNTGKQLWKYHTLNVVWSSPAIDGDKVYIGSHEGVIYCLDLKTGDKLTSFQTGANVFSSPVIDRKLLFVGSDDGFLYALEPGSHYVSPRNANKYVFWDESIASTANGARIKKYLADNGYAVLNQEKLVARIAKADSAANSVVVFATNFFPEEITGGEKNSSLRRYLDAGGKIVVIGSNPLVLKYNQKTKSVVLRGFLYADSVIGIKYGPDDLRSYKGNQPAFRTKKGAEWGMKPFWSAPLSIDPKQVDVVLGSDENGLASAWQKKFNKAEGSGFVQIWAGESDSDLSFITRVAEYGLK